MGVVLFYLIFSLLPLLGLTDAGQEAIQLASFSQPQPFTSHPLPLITNPPPIAAFLNESDIPLVSTSISAADGWLKAHVLARFPSTRNTTIVVARGVLCHRDHEHQWSLVLPSVKNLHYSLMKRGLENVIKVSAAFSSDCLHHPPFPSRFRDDLEEDILKPLLGFLQESKLRYYINPSLHSLPWVPFAHRAAVKKLGYPKLEDIRILRETEPMNRRLYSSSFPSFPEKPKPLVGSPVPAREPLAPSVPFAPVPTREPLAPSVPIAPVPGPSFASVPATSPSKLPHHQQFGHPQWQPPPPVVPAVPAPATPPASTDSSTSPVEAPAFPIKFPPFIPALPKPPAIHPPEFPPNVPTFRPPTPACPVAPSLSEERKLWCVAKPAVPVEKLQEALNYACGEGGADCKAIGPYGNCYYPNTLVAHASYAFNSYWQKAKHSGGTCSFDETAILVNSDPSYLLCQFVNN